MSQKTGIGLFLAFAIVLSFTMTDCANRLAPTGGPKDTIQPFVVNTIPSDQSVNFRGELVIIEFNEWIRENNLRQELLITPPTKDYTHRIVKNRVEIKFQEPLAENTTYSLNFREAIEDITEGNISVIDTIDKRALRLAFSTGDVIDSLSISGQVRYLLNNELISNAVISLYNIADTLQIDEDKPYYFTISDEEGNFTLSNIKAGQYRLYAFDDQNNDLIYQEPEAIDFLTETLLLGDTLFSLTDVELQIAPEDHSGPQLLRGKPSGYYYDLGFDEGLIEVSLDTEREDAQPIKYRIQDSGSEIRLYNQQEIYDSIPISVIAQDSLGNVSELETKILFREKGKKDRSDPFQLQITSAGGKGIENDLDLSFKFSKPVAEFNFDQVTYIVDQDSLTLAPLLQEDSTQEYTWDKTNTLLKVIKKVPFEKEIKLLVDSLAFISIEQDTLSLQARAFNRKDPSEFGTIYGTIETSQAHYILQLLDGNQKLVDQVVDSPSFDFAFLPAGTYSFRVIIDKNQNGRWDGSDVQVNEPAEDVLFPVLPNEGKLREKWDIQATVRF